MSLFQVTKKQVIENYELRTMTGDIVSFTPSYSQLLPDPFSDLNVTVNVVATGGNGTPDNPNPIVGYSSANITRCGVNLWDEEWEVGSINYTTGEKEAAVNRIRSKNYIRINSNTIYYIKQPQGAGRICFYDIDKNHISSDSKADTTFTTPNNAYYMLFTTSTAYGDTYNNNISINYPATDTTYHAYNGQTYAIAFGQTVYGGVLDVTRGKLHVTWGSVDLGDLDWTYRGPDFPNVFSTTDVSVYKIPTLNALCSKYSYGGIVTGISNVTEDETFYFYYIPNSPSRYLYIKDTACTDKNTFITAVTEHKLAYELATPFDIDLTPVQIRALVGENNVFADCGETEVTCLI